MFIGTYLTLRYICGWLGTYVFGEECGAKSNENGFFIVIGIYR